MDGEGRVEEREGGRDLFGAIWGDTDHFSAIGVRSGVFIAARGGGRVNWVIGQSMTTIRYN